MYDEPYEHTREERDGLTIRIVADSDSFNPRTDYDHFGKMICFHSRYTLGDEHDFKEPQDFFLSLIDEERFDRFKNWNWLQYHAMVPSKLTLDQALTKADAAESDWIHARIEESALLLPLFLYDHSGITMSTGAFSCPWDSGQVGWIYATHDDIRREYSRKRLSKKTLDRARTLLEGEVEEYDNYLTGNVWGFIVEDEDGDNLDSCWGFNGEPEYCLSEARRSAAWHAKDIAKTRAEEQEAAAIAAARAMEAARPDMYGSA